MTATLNEMWQRERAERWGRNQPVPAPILSNGELNRLEANAQMTMGAQMLRLFQTL